MSAVDMQIMQNVLELSETQKNCILNLIISFKTNPADDSADVSTGNQSGKRQLGIAKGKTLIAEGYDFDESNPEIAKMFGVA